MTDLSPQSLMSLRDTLNHEKRWGGLCPPELFRAENAEIFCMVFFAVPGSFAVRCFSWPHRRGK